MNDYNKFQQEYYEEQWSKLTLSHKPGATGWMTNVPAPDFLDFVNWLKKEKITGTALDVGCGGGRHSIILAKEGFKVYGIDFSNSAIKTAKENAEAAKVTKNAFFRVGDALKLPYKGQFFDIINDDGCLHHLAKKDWQKYLQNIIRVLKDDGILRIKVFSKNCNFYKKSRPMKTPKNWILVPGKDYTYFFEKNEIVNLFANDFEIIKIEEKYHPIMREKKFFFVILKKK